MAESKALGALLRLVRGVPPGPAEGVAPEALAAVAREQGVGGLLLAEIETGRLAWAVSLREGLQAERRALLARGLIQVQLAARVQRLLAAGAIRSLPLKGVAIADTVCDLESDRPMSDVDLLALEAWPAAVAALRGAGFSELARADHAWAFRDPVSGGVLELHRSVTTAGGLFPCDLEAAWRRRRAGRTQPLELPGAEELLLWLALHASFQHGLVLSLAQWLDFRRVIERERLDGERLRDAAREARAVPALAAALVVAGAVVGLALPAALAPLVERLPRGLRSWLDERSACPSVFLSPSAPSLGRVRWELLAGRRAELVFRTLVLPETPRGDTRLVPRLAHALRRGGQVLNRHLLARGPRPE